MKFAREKLDLAAAMIAGAGVTLAFRGYQFGQGNHNIYLVDALRRCHPELLRHDWFATQTLQYHAAFGWISQWLMRVGWIEIGFLLIYIACLIGLHVAWMGVTRALGGSVRTYLIAVILFYLLAGGIGLGSYCFLQDGCTLPSNIANVAILWGIYQWMIGRRGTAGVCLAIAGVFHLNHAAVAIVIWPVVSLFDPELAWSNRRWQMGTALVLVCCGVNIFFALVQVTRPTPTIDLATFVDLYVKLRHPHHYDPRSWLVALWLTFLVPIPFAFVAWRLARDQNRRAWQSCARVSLVFTALIFIALIFAGIWYVNESLVQMSLFRFSIYLKLMTCIGAAIWVERSWGGRPLVSGAIVIAVACGFVVGAASESLRQVALEQKRTVIAAALVLIAAAISLNRRVRIASVAAMLCVLFIFRSDLGLRGAADDSADYLQLCTWAREHTPIDAIFVVPPSEQSFRLHSERAIIVNFKGAGQLRNEIAEWRTRMHDVLGMDDLRDLPHGFSNSLLQISRIYEARPADELAITARKYGADYLVL